MDLMKIKAQLEKEKEQIDRKLEAIGLLLGDVEVEPESVPKSPRVKRRISAKKVIRKSGDIALDILNSANRPFRVHEVGKQFRKRGFKRYTDEAARQAMRSLVKQGLAIQAETDGRGRVISYKIADLGKTEWKNRNQGSRAGVEAQL